MTEMIDWPVYYTDQSDSIRLHFRAFIQVVNFKSTEFLELYFALITAVNRWPAADKYKMNLGAPELQAIFSPLPSRW